MKCVTKLEKKAFIKTHFWLQVNKNILVDLTYLNLKFSFPWSWRIFKYWVM